MSTQDFVAVLLFVAAFAFVWLAMAGLFMKWSLRWTGAGNVSFLYATSVVLVAMLLSGGVSTGLMFGFPDQPWYVYPMYSLATWILVICVMAKCDPLTAFGAYVIQSFLNGFAITGVTLTVFVVLTFSAPGILERVGRAGDRLAAGDRWSATPDQESSELASSDNAVAAADRVQNRWAAWAATSAADATAGDSNEESEAVVPSSWSAMSDLSSSSERSATNWMGPSERMGASGLPRSLGDPRADPLQPGDLPRQAVPVSASAVEAPEQPETGQELPAFRWQGVPTEPDATTERSPQENLPPGGVRRNPFVK